MDFFNEILKFLDCIKNAVDTMLSAFKSIFRSLCMFKLDSKEKLRPVYTKPLYTPPFLRPKRYYYARGSC